MGDAAPGDAGYPRCRERRKEGGQEADHQPIPNLEETDEREAARFLAGLASDLSPEGEYRTRHPEDYVMEMSQSSERFRGS